jgi:DNA-binding response OmpR family regulator
MEAHILIVDDDIINAEMLSKRLKKRQFKVDIVATGKAAFEFCELRRPDVVLLDILMPDMDGIQVLKLIREKYSQIELPVIMATAKTEPTDLIEALNFGANDFIQKPINIDIAVARLKTQIWALKGHKDEMAKMELEAIGTMIATYNHEINNPLTVAFGFLWKLKKESNSTYIAPIEEALNRIVSIVKKIDNLTTSAREKERYAKEEKIYKVK